MRLDNISPYPYTRCIRVGAYKGSMMSDIQRAVKEKYGAIATSVRASSAASKTGCCGPTACGCGDPITSNLYSAAERGDLPAEAVAASLGCGNPTALLPLEPGQTVLDLGSGGGIDVLLSAKRVGPTGKAYGSHLLERTSARPAHRTWSS
jgi:arsenite methyltransferase